MLKSDTEIGIRLSADSSHFDYLLIILTFLFLGPFSCVYFFVTLNCPLYFILIFSIILIFSVLYGLQLLNRTKIVYVDKDMLFVKGFMDRFDLSVQKIIKITRFSIKLTTYIKIEYTWLDRKKIFWIRQRNNYSSKKIDAFELLTEAIKIHIN